MSISLISCKPNLWLYCLLDYSSLKIHLWRINGSVLCIKEKFQVVLPLPYAISTFRLFIKEKSCSRSTNAMYGAFVIPANLRACLHGGGGTPGRWGNLLMLGKKITLLITCNLTTPASRGALSQDYWMVAKHVKKNDGKPRILAINALLHSLVALAATFSAMAFYC